MNRLTDEQLREYNDAFHLFDRRGRGVLMSQDIKMIVRSLGFNPTDIELENMYLKIDVAGTGKIGFEEFVNLVEDIRKKDQEEESRLECFRAFDKDNKGYIPAQEIKDALMHVMEKCTDKDKELAIKVFRLDIERNVNYEEFRAMVSFSSDLIDEKVSEEQPKEEMKEEPKEEMKEEPKEET